MLVDSHCHLDQLDLSEFGGSMDQVLGHAKTLGVGYFLCVCINMDNFPAVLALAKQYDNVSASVGLHPSDVTPNEPSIETLIEYAQEPEIVAIGETGLDYYRCSGDMIWQQERLRRHIRAAVAVKKPIIIHTREAGADTLRILQEEKACEVGGVIHCFTETLDFAQAAIDLNFYISFSGIITFKNATALQEVAQTLPLKHWLIETDSPYLAPQPFRGKQNQPAYVYYVAESLARIKNVDIQEVATVTTNNFFKLFSTIQR